MGPRDGLGDGADEADNIMDDKVNGTIHDEILSR